MRYNGEFIRSAKIFRERDKPSYITVMNIKLIANYCQTHQFTKSSFFVFMNIFINLDVHDWDIILRIGIFLFVYDYLYLEMHFV